MRRIFEQIQTVEDMSLLNGVAFEEYLADVFRHSGYEVDTTSKSGDYGADLIMARDGKIIVVQAKQHAGAVGFDAVKEVHFAKDFYKADEAWVVATHGFTPQAIRAAESTGVRLISGAGIVRMISETAARGTYQDAGLGYHPEPESVDELDSPSFTFSEVESDSSLFTISGRLGDELLQYHGYEHNIVIPSNLGIKRIASKAFSDPGSYAEWPEGFTVPVCDWASIESVVIPEGVTTIGYASFKGCESLRAVSLPSTLREIGPASFADCMSLRVINLPPSLEVISVGAFEGCVSLREIELPRGIKSIGNFAFTGCKNLSALTLPPSESAVEVGSYAFSESGIGSLAICGNYLLGTNCFERCPSLSSVTIEGIEEEGGGASEPNDQAIGAHGTEIGMESLPDSAFRECHALKHVRLPNTLVSIGDSAFLKCEALQSIEIPEGVTQVGGWAFYDCSELTSIRIPPGVEVIGRSAFASCSALSDVVIPEGVKSIEEDAFFSCKQVKRIVLPTSVEKVGPSAFMDCDALSHIVISPSVRAISLEAFARCGALTNVGLPEGLEVIEELAFGNCTQLKRVMLPASIKTVAPRAFEGCGALEEVCCAPGFSGTIHRSAFLGCPVIRMDDPVRDLSDTATLVNDARFPKMFDGPSRELRTLKFERQGIRVIDRGVEGLNSFSSGCDDTDEVEFWIELNEGCDRGYYAVRGKTTGSWHAEVYDGYLTLEEHERSSLNLSRQQSSILRGSYTVYLHNCHLVASPSIDGALAASLLDAYRAGVTPLVEEFRKVQADESGKGRRYEERKLAALDGLHAKIKAVNAQFEVEAKKIGVDYRYYINMYSSSLGGGLTPSEKAAHAKALENRQRSMTKTSLSMSTASTGCGCISVTAAIVIAFWFAFMLLLFLL